LLQSNEELWAETSQRLTDQVQQIIEFAKFVPGFISLPQDDQIMLLKGGMINSYNNYSNNNYNYYYYC